MNRLKKLAISDEGFIFDPENGNSFTVNQTGLYIIDSLRSGKDPDTIVAEIVETFGVDEEEARDDLLDFLQQLKMLGLYQEEQ